MRRFLKVSIVSVLLLQIVFISAAQTRKTEFEIYFGNDFENDSVTIVVNGLLIAENIKLRPTMISPQNLIIEQDRDSVIVQPYRLPKQSFKRRPIKNSILNLDITLNNIRYNFTFNLKEGKIFYPKCAFFRVGWSYLKILTITQSKQGPMML